MLILSYAIVLIDLHELLFRYQTAAPSILQTTKLSLILRNACFIYQLAIRVAIGLKATVFMCGIWNLCPEKAFFCQFSALYYNIPLLVEPNLSVR